MALPMLPKAFLSTVIFKFFSDIFVLLVECDERHSCTISLPSHPHFLFLQVSTSLTLTCETQGLETEDIWSSMPHKANSLEVLSALSKGAATVFLFLFFGLWKVQRPLVVSQKQW